MAPSRASRATAGSPAVPQALDMQSHSTLACQVQATNAWRRDLRALLDQASERFADVCWTFGDEDVTEIEDGEIGTFSSISSHTDHSSAAPTIWAHKAILFARASNSFQARYLQLRTPAANLGALAGSSSVSLPVVQPIDSNSITDLRSDASIRSRPSVRKTVRGPVPPSSYARLHPDSAAGFSNVSDSEGDDTSVLAHMRRSTSNASMSSLSVDGEPLRLSISRPISALSNTSSRITRSDATDALSVISTTSTVRAPMNLPDISPNFFGATLEYLYTAEESVVDVFEFLYEDRIGPDDGAERRLDKLRQDLVFMWRSRLYSDIDIVLGEDHVRSIPDANASVFSLAPEDRTDEEEAASFSAHRMILASRSPYFAAQLLSPYSDAQSRLVHLPSPPFTPAAMHFALGFMYTGTLFFSHRTFDLSTAFQLWQAGSYLQIETLQNLISSLIAADFCHGFACSPPCKTCVKRVPRTMTFVSRPDVSDVRLRAMALNAVSGDHFGAYWQKEIGNLDYATCGSIVADVCAKIEQRPGFIIVVLRQLAIVGGRVDIERSTKWVESLRWMCESVHAHVRGCISANFGDVVGSQEWQSIILGVGFMNDVLEKTLTVLLDNLDETTTAKNYEILVGNVLLHEEHLPSQSVAVVVEEARHAILQYVKKRWMNIRSAGGFNKVEKWALKEMADEIDVPAADLLLPDDDAMHEVGRRSTYTPFASSSAGNAAALWSSSKRQRLPAPGSMIDGEREAGPIHLRAAVLNRNAARASTTLGRRLSSAESPLQSNTSVRSADTARAGSSRMSELLPPIESSATRQEPVSRASTVVPSMQELTHTSAPDDADSDTSVTTPTSSPGRLSGLARFPSPPESTQTTPTRDRPSPTTRIGQTTPRASGSIVRHGQSLATSRPTAAPSTSTSSTVRRPAPALKSKTSSSSVSQPRRTTSTQSLASTRASSIGPIPPTPPVPRAKAGERIRSTSSASAASVRTAKSTSAVGPKSASASTKAVLRPATSATNSFRPGQAKMAPKAQEDRRLSDATSIRSTSGAESGRQKSAVSLRSAFAAETSAAGGAAAATQPVPMQLDHPAVPMVERQAKGSAAPSFATRLSQGIPCVIAPTTRNGKPARFRAIVKYIGPLHARADASPQMDATVVGVEITLPLPAGLDETSFDFHDGMYGGQEYFRIGTPDHDTVHAMNEASGSERAARRRRIDELLRSHFGEEADPVPVTDKGDDTHTTITLSSLPSTVQDGVDRREGATLPSPKRRKDLQGLGQEPSTATQSRGLFIRPQEVLWVVV